MTASALDERLLRSFLAVAEELHFGRAARRVHLSQPQLSVHVQKLEAALGAQLFERSRRQVALSEAGAFLLPRARGLLAEGERTAREVHRIATGEAGVLSIGYAATASHEVLPRLVPRFLAQQPGVRLELFEMPSAEQPEALKNGRIELGFGCGPGDFSGLIDNVLVEERLIVALPEGHRLTRSARIELRHLRVEPCVALQRAVEPAWADAVTLALSRVDVELPIVQRTDSSVALLGLVAAGVGLCVVSESTACLRRTGVVFRPLHGLDTRLRLSLLTRRVPSARAKALVELAKLLHRTEKRPRVRARRK